GIIPVSTTVDLKKLAKAMNTKRLTLAPVADAERISGYVAGDISPLGQRRRLPTIIDESAKQWGTILVSGGGEGGISNCPHSTSRASSGRDSRPSPRDKCHCFSPDLRPCRVRSSQIG